MTGRPRPVPNSPMGIALPAKAGIYWIPTAFPESGNLLDPHRHPRESGNLLGPQKRLA